MMDAKLLPILCCTVSAALSLSLIPVEYLEPDQYSQKFHRQFNQNTQAVNYLEEPQSIQWGPSDNSYYLYTRNNPTAGQILNPENEISITRSNFDADLVTVVISHGWLSTENNDMNHLIRNAYLNRYNVNVIVLDWRRLSMSGYVTAVNGVPCVGRELGNFIRFLINTTGATVDKFHLIGFSLGAHVVGHAGRTLGEKVARITALDPAVFLWDESNRLDTSDAKYVEVIHTYSGLNGMQVGPAIGHADFFPNGGEKQPGCVTAVCHHDRAWRFYAATVTYDHLIARRCASMLMVRLNLCLGNTYAMGNADLKKFGTGLYRVNTQWFYPY